MRPRVAAVLSTVAIALPMSVTAQSSSTTTLAALRDNASPLLIFSNAQDTRTQQQLADLEAHVASVKERDMRIVLIAPATQPTNNHPDLPVFSLSADAEAQARQRFHIAPGEFAVVLVGKDGGEKLRASQPIPWQKLASTIDAMPMRKDEMKQR